MQSMTTIRTIPTVIQVKPTTLDFHSGALAREAHATEQHG